MKLVSKALIVHADDWAALYLDGKLASQGHSLRVEALLSALDITYAEATFKEDEDGYIDVPFRSEDLILA